jgi:hypothetical protein
MGLYDMFDEMNDMFDEIDEEMCLVLDSVSAIREMVEKGQKKKALEALMELEAELDDFLTIPEEDEEEEGDWEDVDEEEKDEPSEGKAKK